MLYFSFVHSFIWWAKNYSFILSEKCELNWNVEREAMNKYQNVNQCWSWSLLSIVFIRKKNITVLWTNGVSTQNNQIIHQMKNLPLTLLGWKFYSFFIFFFSFRFCHVLLCIMKISKCSKKNLYINSHQHLLKWNTFQYIHIDAF
jgi:hypothetical protein